MKEKTKKYHLNTKYTDEVLSDLADSLCNWIDDLAKRKEFGMLGDWAFQNGFSPKNFKKYADKHDEFRQAYEWAKAYQEHMVSRGALTKSMDARFAIFFLGCNHDWKTKGTDDDSSLVNSFSQFVEYMNSRKKSKAEQAIEKSKC